MDGAQPAPPLRKSPGDLAGAATGANARSAGTRAPRAQSARLLIEQTIALNDADVTPAPPLQFGHQVGRGYTSWAAHGSAFTLANWDAGPATGSISAEPICAPFRCQRTPCGIVCSLS